MTKLTQAFVCLILFITASLSFLSCKKTDKANSSTVTSAPFPPTDLTATVISPTQVDLKWLDKSTNEIGFKIEKKTTSTNFVLLVSIPSDITSYSDTSLTPNTSYTYRVFSYNSVGSSPTYTNEVTVITLAVDTPTVSTKALSNLTTTTATLGGDISNDGRRSVTSRGICWSTSPKPTVALTTKTSDGTGTGSFESNITGLTPGTTYYVRAYATNSVGTGYGNELSFTTLTIPTLTTTSLSNITALTASGGGNITNDGGTPITARGVVWSNQPNPTLTLVTKTSDGIGAGAFSSKITGLTETTIYYVRAYATNKVGTSYGNEVSFKTIELPPPTTGITAHSCGATNVHNSTIPYGTMTDQEGNVYRTVKIGTQVWMAENLKTTKYSNGVSILSAVDSAQWVTAKSGAYSSATSSIGSAPNIANDCPYGKLYNWYAVINESKICPTGWHVPSDAEWRTLVDLLGGESVAGGKMKSAGVNYWQFINRGGTNSSGFSALPAGGRFANAGYLQKGFTGYFWSSTESNMFNGFASFWTINDDVERIAPPGAIQKESGFSVRCVKD